MPKRYLWMSRNSYTSGHSFWTQRPRPLYRFLGGKPIDCMYCDGGERVTGDVYNLEKLLPKLVLQGAGYCRVSIEECEDGSYVIRREPE